jgi:hypothetical protein
MPARGEHDRWNLQGQASLTLTSQEHRLARSIDANHCESPLGDAK